jgi:hypothetical protein
MQVANYLLRLWTHIQFAFRWRIVAFCDLLYYDVTGLLPQLFSQDSWWKHFPPMEMADA